MRFYWRAVQHDTGRVLDEGQRHKLSDFGLASDQVDLAWKFMGQGDTVTLELVDESGTVTARRAPHPKPMPIDPERLPHGM